MERSQRIAGCILGGAIGDALGWPVEFLSSLAIRKAYGEEGIQDLDLKDKPCAEFTDDTQMTFFSAEGALRYLSAQKQAKKSPDFATIMHASYRRWLFTQQTPKAKDQPILNGWLYACHTLHVRRAPGNSCLQSLNESWIGSVNDPINDSKGCGAVMRAAPLGIVFDAEDAFTYGMMAGAITHGHPSGYLSSAALARIIAGKLSGDSRSAALDSRARSVSVHSETCPLRWRVVRSSPLFSWLQLLRPFSPKSRKRRRRWHRGKFSWRWMA